MFKEPTVLILGAGASHPYGYPLGKDLLQSIKSGIAAAINHTQNYSSSTANIDFFNAPYKALIESARRNPPPFLGDDYYIERSLADLRTDLSDSHRTIDEFARINPQWRGFLKILIAIEIGRATFQRDAKDHERSIANKNMSNPEKNAWYSLLIHELRNGAGNAGDLAANELSIVTFNYDCSLEWHFDRELGQGRIFAGFDMLKAPSITHVHGRIDLNLVGSPSQPNRRLKAKYWDEVCNAADKFVMIDEEEVEAQNHLRNIAREKIASAKRIFILGCDLHEQNTNLLKLDKPEIAARCVVLNWNGTPRVSQRAIELGIESEHILSGTQSAPLEIFSAIEDGGLFSMRP